MPTAPTPRSTALALLRAAPFALALIACGAAVEGDIDTAPDDTPQRPRARLLDRIEAEFAEYTDWEQIPGWEGTRPSNVGLHGAEVAIYFNDLAMTDPKGEVDGASSFKEVYGSGGTLAALHVMTFDADYGWFYAVMSPAGVVDEAGRLAGCTGCHESPPRSGFLAPWK